MLTATATHCASCHYALPASGECEWCECANPEHDPTASRLDPDNPEYVLVDSGEPQAYGYLTPADIETLRDALSLDRVHTQGVSIPSGSHYWEEYIARAEGRTASRHGEQYWD